MIKADEFHGYFGYKTVVPETRLQGTISPIKEIPGSTTFLTESTFCIDQAVFYSRSSDVGHVSEEVLLES
jgi:hypothetical protein